MHFDFSSLRVAVVGDLILDCYLEGSVGRLSPEAPVPVLLHRAERKVLGGALNVAANLASLDAQVEIVGLVGQDGRGADLTTLLDQWPTIDRTGIVVDPGRPTTCKTRVTAGLYQLVRIDSESTTLVSGAAEDALIAAIEACCRRADVVILSDYAKGVASDRVIRSVIEAANRAGKPSIIDPKRDDFSIYAGATLIKPNKRELTTATRLACGTDEEAEAAARVAIERTGSSMLLTRSERGMSFFGVEGPVLHLPTAARDVFDVSGAGDTVVAVAALGYAAGFTIPETMRLANVAAGIVVAKIGTAVVTSAELDTAIRDLAHRGTSGEATIVSLDAAVQQREHWRRLGLRVGVTNGCFDILHPGHVSLLRQAAEACDRLIVAINTDASVRRLKGPTRPVQDEASRAAVLGALRMVDLVMTFDEDTPATVIEALKPDLLVKGADYREDQVVGADFVKAQGGRLLLVNLTPNQSTTSIIRRSGEGQSGSA